jgi:VWFA-related protein
VRDLTPEEIEILDHGAPQKIAFLEPYYKPGGPRLPEGAPMGPEDIPRIPSAEPVPQVVPDRAMTPGRWLVLIFDNYIANQGTKLKALEAARNLLRERIEPGDNVAVISFYGKFELVQPFTGDLEKLHEALDIVSGQLDRAASDRYQALDDLMEQIELCQDNLYPASCARGYAGAYVDARRREADAFLSMLLHVVRSVAPIPDAKAVVLFSNGFTRTPEADAMDASRFVLGDDTIDRMLFSQDYKLDQNYDDLAAAAAEGKVTIFTINPGGAMGNELISAERRGFYDESKRAPSIDVYRNTDRNHQHGLSELARRTGGRASQSPNVDAALERVLDVSEGLYTVGYYPNREVPSRIHDVKIKIRRKGVKAVTRKELPEVPRKAPLVGDLSVRQGECYEGERRSAEVSLRLDVDHLTFDEVGKKFVNNFSLYIRFSDGNGLETLHQDYRFFNISYEPEVYRTREIPDPTFQQTLLVPCTPLTVEIVATDVQSGARVEFRSDIPADPVVGGES